MSLYTEHTWQQWKIDLSIVLRKRVNIWIYNVTWIARISFPAANIKFSPFLQYYIFNARNYTFSSFNDTIICCSLIVANGKIENKLQLSVKWISFWVFFPLCRAIVFRKVKKTCSRNWTLFSTRNLFDCFWVLCLAITHPSLHLMVTTTTLKT